MNTKGILVAFVIVLIVTSLIQTSLQWPQWTMFVATGIITVILLFTVFKGD